MRQLQLPAKGGYFDVIASDDPDYPGIDIEYVPKKNAGDYTLPRVVVEFPRDSECPRVLVWDDPGSEDYTAVIPLTNIQGRDNAVKNK